jgi:tetratricopeptide (TPR) repeat protein
MNGEGNPRIKISVIIAVVIGLAIALGYWCLPAYRHFKEKHIAAQAQSFFDHGDYSSALLSARQELLINSNNVTTCRVMAGLADIAHSPATLDWYLQVVKLSPTITNKLLLASAGLRYQSPPYPLTTQILEDLSQSAAQVPDFHIVSAELALALHHMAEAQAQFEAVCQLDPTNRLYQLNLAVVRLGSTNATMVADARAKLKQFCNDAKLGPLALRSLIADRLLHNDVSGALDYSTQLLAGTGASLNDRLQHLGILKHLHSPQLAGQLNTLQEQCTTNALMIAQVASWMTANGFLTEATGWLNRLPGNLQSQLSVRLALVDCYLAGKNWQMLRDFASKGSWEDMEFLRLAYLSRAWNKLDEPMMADGDWNSAVSLANNQLGALNYLLELAGRWGMMPEQEDLLWRILRRFPDAGWAQNDLGLLYSTSGNTKGLYQLYSERFPVSPQNVELKNNLTFTALLLKTNLNSAYQWAAEDYARETNDPVIVSTYAYALHLQGRDKDGLAALQKLNRAELEQPSVALYYGVLLSATGKNDEAQSFLQIAQTEGRLLPEEKQLLAETLR